jgi:hypothetical protein
LFAPLLLSSFSAKQGLMVAAMLREYDILRAAAAARKSLDKNKQVQLDTSFCCLLHLTVEGEWMLTLTFASHYRKGN